MTGELTWSTVVAVAVALVAIGLRATAAKIDDGPRPTCSEIKIFDREQFAAKTLYRDSRARLQALVADRAALPNSFDQTSLKKRDQELRSQNCKPLVLYFVGRHSARFPDVSAMKKYHKNLGKLIEHLKSADASPECQREYLPYIGWESMMRPEQGDLDTDIGAKEQRELAKRFKQIYPEFFDAKTAEIKIGVTNTHRTAQTAAAFLHEIAGVEVEGCDEQSLPTDDPNQLEYDLDKVLNAPCYKNLREHNELPLLAFHDQCKQIAAESADLAGPVVKDQRIERIKAPGLKRRIADRVAIRLGLNNSGLEPPVSVGVVESIYNMCRFEIALKNSSIWCNLLERRDTDELEFIEDTNSYIKSAYGPNANTRQSCPLVKDLVEAMLKGSRSDSKRGLVKSYFYFSHADPFKKLLGTFELFRDEGNFNESRLADFEHNSTVPKLRSWRTSLISPFSANLAFILYGCDSGRSKTEQSRYRILSTVSEQPVKLGGCSSSVCSAKSFFGAYDKMRNCDMERICGNKQRPNKLMKVLSSICS